MSEELTQNQLETAIQIGMEKGLPRTVEIGAQPYTVIPTGAQLVNLEKLLPAPVIKRGTPSFGDLASFARYVADHRTPATVIFFAPPATSEVTATAVFDYHEPGENGKAGWKEHKAVWNLPVAEEWQAWRNGNQQSFTQEAFALHIERNIADIASPNGADLLELTQSLTARIMTEFGSVVRGGGTTKTQFMEAREASGGPNNVQIPARLLLGLPVYKGFSRYEVQAAIRLRINDKHLVMSYELLQMQKVLDAASEEVVKAVAQATQIAPLLGRLS